MILHTALVDVPQRMTREAFSAVTACLPHSRSHCTFDCTLSYIASSEDCLHHSAGSVRSKQYIQGEYFLANSGSTSPHCDRLQGSMSSRIQLAADLGTTPCLHVQTLKDYLMCCHCLRTSIQLHVCSHTQLQTATIVS